MRDTTIYIPLGDSLTTNKFNNILNEYYESSFEYMNVHFDIGFIEWVSLPELLLFVKWINNLTLTNCKVDVISPHTHFVVGVDGSIDHITGEKPNFKPMHRRGRVLSFLERLGFHNELQRITSSTLNNNILKSVSNSNIDLMFNNINDPYEATILPIMSFSTKNDLDIKKKLSNQELKTLLREYSVLDYVDSGLLSDVLIEELVTNAITHGSRGNSKNEISTLPCAWITARLVKSSFSLVKESPKWLSSTFNSLIGKHYLEIVLCDSGVGIYDQLKESTPGWLFSKPPSVKAILDYAFDKYSTSSNKLRSEHDALPRGLFWVHDLLRQYGGMITIRSNGFYMGYDFLSRRETPRLLGLWDDEGSCQDISGTSIQLILPEAKNIPINIHARPMKSESMEPVIFLIDPPNNNESVKVSAQNYAKEIESMCHGGGNFVIYIDFMSFKFTDETHRMLFVFLIRYILYFQNPHLFWLLIPKDGEILPEVNSIITLENKAAGTSDYDYIFKDFCSHDRRITPAIMPNGEIYWLGATKLETKYLQYLSGATEALLEDLGEDHVSIVKLAHCNPNLLVFDVNNIQLEKSKLSLKFDIFNVIHTLENILTNTAESIVLHTPNTLHSDGCYHLPHGKYSNCYLYLKPVLIHNYISRRLSRYIVSKISLTPGMSTKDIDTVIGGTHSAKRLIHQISEELSTDFITIDRYIDQIDDPSIEPKVANKNIIIITDVISSGSFVEKISDKLLKYGSKIIVICSIVDLRENYSEEINNIKVLSLFRFPVKRLAKANRMPVYEINPISLRPTILEKERARNLVPDLLGKDELVEIINNSRALVPSHTVLGPTHYAYFVDTYELLKSHAKFFFDLIDKNITEMMAKHDLKPSKDITALITAEGSNAELFMPDLIMKKYPQAIWLQIDRIRLSKEGAWQLDRLDENLDPINSIQNSVVLIWDDGSNTGSTLIQLLEIVSEFNPKIIFAFCLINRQSPARSRFMNKIRTISNKSDSDSPCGSKIYVQFVGTLPISTYVNSNCPICSHKNLTPPPIFEIEKYWSDFLERTAQNRWSHISASEIRAKAYSLLDKLNLGDVEKFIKLTFKIRCSLGNFENTIGTTKDERTELIGFLATYQDIVSLAFIFTQEPQLLESVINFQLPGFKEFLFKSILELINDQNVKIDFGEKVIVEFIAEINPNFICDNLEKSIIRLLKTKEICDILISRIINIDDKIVSIEVISCLLQRLEPLNHDIDITAYLRGLCNASLSWLRFKQSETLDDDLKNSIISLQEFYRVIGKPHEQSKDYSAPLHRILNIVERFKKFKHIPDDLYFNSVYRDWRDYTVNVIEKRLAPAIKSSHSILSQDLDSYLRRYFLPEKSDLRRDYLSLQKDLLELREASNKSQILEEKSDQILRATSRIYDRVFSPIKSPIAKVVNKIPAYVVKHINQRLENSLWITENNIQVEMEEPTQEINGFMSSYLFKQILDGIFSNIMKHNFNIGDSFIADHNNKILIKVKIKTLNVVIIIKSNGVHKYNGIPSHGIRNIENKCKAFNGTFAICNEGQWVKNEIIIGRF